MHNYFLIEHNYSQHVIYNFKSELQFWKNYNVVKITTIRIIISGIIMKLVKFFLKKSVIIYL